VAGIIWKYTREDIKIRTRLRLGETQAQHMQEYQTFATLLSGVLGTKEDDSTPDSDKSSSGVPSNFADAQRQLAAVFGKS
jgi:hypothetical protein